MLAKSKFTSSFLFCVLSLLLARLLMAGDKVLLKMRVYVGTHLQELGLRMRFFGLGALVMEKLGVATSLLPGREIFPLWKRGRSTPPSFPCPLSASGWGSTRFSSTTTILAGISRLYRQFGILWENQMPVREPDGLSGSRPAGRREPLHRGLVAASRNLSFGDRGTLIAMLLLVFLLGLLLDWIEITLIVLPLLAPVVSAMNLAVNGHGVVDNPQLVWFALLVAMTLQTSFLTPPVGFALFYLKGVCPPGVSLKHIYRGVVPFIFLQLAALVLVIVFPDLVTWLPAVAYGR